MASLTGPLTNTAVVGGSRASRTRAPFSNTDTEYVVFFDDFFGPVSTVGTTATSPWTVISDTGTTALGVDTPNGVILMTSASATEDQGCSIQLTQEMVDLSSGNEAWFETRLMLTDADQTDVFAGFSVNWASDPEAVKAAADRIGFELEDASAVWDITCERGGTETLKSCDGTTTDGLLSVMPATSATDLTSATDPDDSAWTKLGIHVSGTNDNGGGIAIFYIDDVKVGTLITNIPDNTFLSFGLMNLNGEATENIMYVDYVYAAWTR